MKKKIIYIVGPTASGKTKLSTDIAKKYSGEIISCDSMQIYKEFDIGTAKISYDEMNGITHYMINNVDPTEKYSVSDYKIQAEEYIDKIYSKNKIPIIVGGTGLYFNSIYYNYSFSNLSQNDIYLSKKISKIYYKFGIDFLYDMLLLLDYDSKNNVHKNNVKRVIRAIEICLLTNSKFSKFNKIDKIPNNKFDNLVIGLNMSRETLYDKINKRVDKMMQIGLLDEVKNLSNKYGQNIQPFTAIGYKELLPYINKDVSDLEECVEKIKQNSRKYAKRQLTWFNSNENINWINVERNYRDIFKDANTLVSKFINKG